MTRGYTTVLGVVGLLTATTQSQTPVAGYTASQAQSTLRSSPSTTSMAGFRRHASSHGLDQHTTTTHRPCSTDCAVLRSFWRS